MQDLNRLVLIDTLYTKYSRDLPVDKKLLLQIQFWRKKYTRIFFVAGARIIRRLLDILVSGVGLVVLSPVYLIVALCIKLTDRGPAIYWQMRVGRWGKEFPFPKFRSMILDAENQKDQFQLKNDHQTSITFKMKQDPRVTWIGRIIRRYSIDELPQLWSVLIGDMTLVGPRPSLPHEVAQYSLADRRRLDVTPGLTCIWQVSGRGDLPFHRQVELDVEYINNQCFRLDLKIMLKTIPAVLLGKGAY